MGARKKILIVLCFILIPNVSAEWSLPADRSVDWSFAGIPGGIPDRDYDGGNDDIDVTASPYNADNRGVSDAASAIQSALDACASDDNCDVVYLPAGTYYVNDRIEMPSGVTLRGAGKDSTNWRIGLSVNTGILIGDPTTLLQWEDSDRQKMDITSGYTKGSTSLVMDGNAESMWSVGDFAIITQKDGTVGDGLNPLITYNAGRWCGQDAIDDSYGTDPITSGRRSIGQIVEITNIDAGTDTITFQPALAHTYESKYDPELSEMVPNNIHGANPVTYSGVEDMYIHRTGANPNGRCVGCSHVLLQGTAYSWVKECKLYLCDTRIIQVYTSFRNTIHGNDWSHSVDYASGGRGYQFDLNYYSSSNLIENNAGCYANAVYQLNNPGHGNVFAYNWGDGAVQEAAPGWQNDGMGIHCMHPMYTLFEGNDVSKWGNDGYWGSMSHMVAFRNHFRSDDAYPCTTGHTDDIQPLAAVELSNVNTITLAGNVLGQPSFPHDDAWTGYEWESSGHSGWGQRHVYYTTITNDDRNGKNTWIRHGNFDYYNNDVIWCNEVGGNCQGGSQDQDLPDSLYLTSKPSWWDDQGDGRSWPPIGPDVTGYVVDIPAKDRFEGEIYQDVLTCGTDGVDNSCTISEMNSLISSASDGDTIRIATGTHDWTPSLSTYVSVNKRIIISGGGSCPNCGTSNPTNGASWPVQINLPASNTYSVFRIEVTSAGLGIARITGIHFTGDTYAGYAYGSQNYGGFISVKNNDIAQYRIDNSRFAVLTTGSSADLMADLWISPLAYGLIDHNFFNPPSANGKAMCLNRLAADEEFDDCQESYTDENVWGSADFTFFEDNTVLRPHSEGVVFSEMCIDAWCGSRFVIRNNYLQNCWSEHHGHSWGTWVRSGYAAEMYDNTINCTRDVTRAFWTRGGTLLLYDNVHSGSTYGWAFLQQSLPGYGHENWQPHDGTQDWDGNCQAGSSNPNAIEPSDCGQAGVPYPAGYPIIDSVGRGQASGTTTTTIQPQNLDPVRMWNNTYSGSNWHQASTNPSDHNYLNRDTYFCADASCPWVSSFTATYTPYTYPHPLTQITTDCIPVTTEDLMQIIVDWKQGTGSMSYLMSKIKEWKEGCP